MQGSYSLLSLNLYYIVNLYLAYTVTDSEKNVWIFDCGCLFYQNSFASSVKFMLSRIFLWTCTSARACSRCFALIWSMLLRTSKKKTCAHFRHLWLVKVKVTLQSFLLHLLRCFYFLYLAFFLNNGVHNNCIIIFKFK